MTYDVVSLGELLIDMVPLPAPAGALNFAAKPGGAPGNVGRGSRQARPVRRHAQQGRQ